MLRVGIAGCGFMGRMHASAYSLIDGVEVAAFYDRRPEKREAYAADCGAEPIGSFDQLVESVDAVDVCLPTNLHASHTVQALRAERPVLCEKPMALTLEEADQMVEAAEQTGQTLLIGHCIRYWPEYALLKQIADDGRYGPLLSVNLTRYGEFPHWSSDNWLADENLSGGGALDMHIHDTDFALYLLGEPDEVRSFGTVDSTGAAHAFTTMRFGTAVAHLEGGWNLPPKTPFKMAFRAVFERAAAIMDGGPMTVFPRDGEPWIPEFPKMEAAGGGNISDLGGYYHEVKDFVDCVREGRKPTVVTPGSSRRSLAMALEEIRQIKSAYGG
jgi:predicted dehydrogenase